MQHRYPRTPTRRFARAPLAGIALALAVAHGTAHGQEYSSSVVGTEFDFIRDTDPSAFTCLEFKGRALREMPDKTGPTPLIQEAFIFVSYYEDGTSVDMAIDVDFETEELAYAEALRYVSRLGKLPTTLRRGVERMVVHRGAEDATAFSDRGLMVLYSDNASKRISTHDLEETVFHESVHAAWDLTHGESSEWLAAQRSDGAFVTRYAQNDPDGEDLAESALFAYTLLHHPGRIPPADAARIREAIPARMAFVETLLPPERPILFEVGPKYACDGSGETFHVDESRLEAQRERERNTVGQPVDCDVDITLVGVLSDILSNALMHGFEQDESVVRSFLSVAKREFRTPDDLIEATADRFGLDVGDVEAAIEDFYHCNCNHGDVLGLVADVEFGAPEPVDDEPADSTPPAAADDAGTGELRPLLVTIAALLGLLLLVNATTLAVLVKRSKRSA